MSKRARRASAIASVFRNADRPLAAFDRPVAVAMVEVLGVLERERTRFDRDVVDEQARSSGGSVRGEGRSRESKFRATLMTVTEAEAIAAVVSAYPELIFERAIKLERPSGGRTVIVIDAGKPQLWGPEGLALLQMYLDDHLPASVRAEYDVRVD